MVKKVMAAAMAVAMVFGAGTSAAVDVRFDTAISASAVYYEYGDLEFGVDDDGAYIHRYLGEGKEVVIPSEIEGLAVTSIDFNAFRDCDHVTRVVLPDSITLIGNEAFPGCTSLESINIPKGVTFIGEKAFSGCTSLKSVTIPDGIEYLGTAAFADCSSLKDIVIPKSFKEFDGDPFEGTLWAEDRMKEDPASLLIVNGILLNGKHSKGDIVIPQGVTKIVEQAFADNGMDGTRENSLTGVTIPSSVKEISQNAFWNCAYLERVTISEGVEKIGGFAFHSCPNLISVNIPASVREIGMVIFGSNNGTFPENFEVSCYPGTVGEEYVKGYGYNYKLLGRKKGDVNHDGAVNLADLALVTAHVKNIEKLADTSAADVNDDGVVNLIDVAMIAAHVKNIEKLQ